MCFHLQLNAILFYFLFLFSKFCGDENKEMFIVTFSFTKLENKNHNENKVTCLHSLLKFVMKNVKQTEHPQNFQSNFGLLAFEYNLPNMTKNASLIIFRVILHSKLTIQQISFFLASQT